MFFWEGDINNRYSFFYIILYLCLFVFSLSAADTTGDDYFKKVKSVMQSDDTLAGQNEEETQEKKNGRVKFSIGYLSYIKIIVVLGLVILIIYGISLILKRALRLKGDNSNDAAVLTTQALGPGKWIQVVYAGGKFMVLGVTNENINLLTEITDPKEIERYEILINERQVNAGKNFIDIFSGFIKDTLRLKTDKKKFDYEMDTLDFLKDQKNRLNKINNHDQEL